MASDENRFNIVKKTSENRTKQVGKEKISGNKNEKRYTVVATVRKCCKIQESRGKWVETNGEGYRYSYKILKNNRKPEIERN